MKTRKRGISLIVLVITIIVMIILATAIILSLNSSNILGKAGEAKLTSDLSNKKEAASVYVAEYEIKVAKGKINKATTVDAYVKAEMKKAGIDTSDVAIQEDGTILVGIAAQFVNKQIPVGTEVDGYKLNNTTTYKTSGKENTYSSSTAEATTLQSVNINRDSTISWKYMGVDENGNALIVGNLTESSPKMTLGAKGGYVNGPKELNDMCKAVYSSAMGTARSITWEDVVRVLNYNGPQGYYTDKDAIANYADRPFSKSEVEKRLGESLDGLVAPDGTSLPDFESNYVTITFAGPFAGEENNLVFPGVNYWLASKGAYVFWHGGYGKWSVNFYVRYITTGDYGHSTRMFSAADGYSTQNMAIRPVVELNPSVQMTYNGTKVTLK